MDKTEYQIKLDEINRLVDLQEYEDALEIIDTIEWKRVKSVKTLCMVAEIYEINGELEESMKILQMAYKRSSLGKTILYRQVELALKMKKYHDAVKYYNKYLEAASNDTTKYILKYKIYKAQKAPLEDLIVILEEYKEREYTERWVYELAKLYKQADNQRKCVETCDDLILWFGEGKYVIKAMELKMTYVPLSAAQKSKYDQYKKEEAEKAAKLAESVAIEKTTQVTKSSAEVIKSLMKTTGETVKQPVNVNSELVKQTVKPTVETIKTVKLPKDPAKSIVKAVKEIEKPATVQKKFVQPSFESISAAAKNSSQKAPSYIKKEPAFVLPTIEENSEILKEAAVTIEPETKVVVPEIAGDEIVKSVEISKENLEESQISENKVETDEIVEVENSMKESEKEVSVEPVIEDEFSLESILAAAAAEIMAEKEAEEQNTIIQENVETPVVEEDVQIVSNQVVDQEELQKNLAKSLEQVFSGLHRSKMTQSFENFGKYIGSEIPKGIFEEENFEDYLMKELAPENEDDTLIALDLEENARLAENLQESEEPVEEAQESEEPVEEAQESEEPVEEEQESEEAQESEEPVEEAQESEEPVEEAQESEEPVEEPQESEEPVEEAQESEELVEEAQESEEPVEEAQESEEPVEAPQENKEEHIDLENFELDLEALFAETSSDFARMIESFANESVEVNESVQETPEEEKEPEMSEEEAEPVQETPEEEKEPEVSEEEAEPVQEISEEEKEPEVSEEEAELVQETPEEEVNTTDDIDAEAAMLAFEASLLESLNSIPGLESYQFEDLGTVEEVAEVTETEESEESAEATESEESEEPVEVTETEESEEPVKATESEESEESVKEIEPEESEESVEVTEPEESEKSVEVTEPEESEKITEDLEIKEITIEEITADVQNEVILDSFVEEDNGFDIDFEAQLVAETESFLNREETTKEPEQEIDIVERLMMEADQEPTTYQSLADETPEDKRRRILNEKCQTVLSDDQKALFSYFCKVPGMNNQILDAINGVYRYADERTSRRGNIAIMGSHGMGKTRLGEGLVKAICKQFGIHAAKYARIDALELNKKDIATVVGKMAGGFLMVERAHLMTPATVGQLATAMEFRTDSMVLIIEDEKAEMRQLLSEYPHFAEKIETIISIPVFTNDELVTFARTYAKENGFKMDELGVLALYALIGDNQREDEPVTVGRVKSMVDAAIRHATNARLGRRLSKRHVDEDGRILLYEKDFED